MDGIEYQDFLPSVRKSLYAKAKSIKKNKKLKFTSDYSADSDSQSAKLKKLSNMKTIPFKKKSKKRSLLQYDNEPSNDPCSLQNPKREKYSSPKSKFKKKQALVSYAISSDSFDEELKDIELTPSKSELENFQNAINNSSKRLYDGSDSTSEDDDDIQDFDLQAFFNSWQVGDLNDSVTEAHSGIDHEFVSDYAKNVRITESEPFCRQEEESIDDEYCSQELEETISKILDVHRIPPEQAGCSSDDDPVVNTSPMIIEEDQQLDEEIVTADSCTAEYHKFGNKKLVVLKEGQSISFHGMFTLKVLQGKVEVLGSVLDKNSNSVNLYSPRGSALLCIKNVGRNHDENYETVNIGELIQLQYNDDDVSDIFVEANGAVLLCTKLEDHRVFFVEKYISQKIFPRTEDDNEAQVIFEPIENLNILRVCPLWDDILTSVTSRTKLIIVGGKGVGKSTILRFAINRLLNKFEKVRVLDLDPGQSEFAVPGCVSVVTITEPVFGPNFTHLRQTERSLLSNINVSHDPRAYLKCIKHLVSYMDMLAEEVPVLINYMGFVQGIGCNIIASAIEYIQPTDIIQIHSKSHSKNFKIDLTPKEVEEYSKLLSNENEENDKPLQLNYKLHKVPAMTDNNEGWRLEPRLLREMNVLAYFGQIMVNGAKSLTSHEIPIYEIKLSEIKIANLQGEEISPAVVNANMVALCSLDQESNIFVCKGYGVIRGIDIECDKLVLVTPEPATVLEEVYYLVLGSVFLPPSIYMSPDNVSGAIPYIMEGELVSLGQITKRSYLPVGKK